METRQLTHFSYSIPEVETQIENLNNSLKDYCSIQGKQDGKKRVEIQEFAFNVKVLDYVRSCGQETIDLLKQAALIGAQVLNVSETEEIGNQKCNEIQSQMDDMEHELIKLEREKQSWTLSPAKINWLWIVAPFVALADGALAYGAFRINFSTLNSLIASAAIALVIAVSHLLYAPWIMKTQLKIKRYIKIGIVLIVAFLFFYWISVLRSQGINNTINLQMTVDSTLTGSNQPHVSPWTICGISFTLFTVVLFLSLVSFRSKEERMRDTMHKKTCTEIETLETKISACKSEINKIQSNILVQKRDARLVFDYVMKCLQRIKNICYTAVALYKQIYTRYHTTAPSFFSKPVTLVFDENLKLFEPEIQQ